MLYSAILKEGLLYPRYILEELSENTFEKFSRWVRKLLRQKPLSRRGDYGSYGSHRERAVETWHAVDRFTMTTGKHENGKLRPGIATQACRTRIFPPLSLANSIIRLYREHDAFVERSFAAIVVTD